jgi:hypothetical protein
VVCTGVELIVFEGGRVVEWDFAPAEEPELEELQRVELEPELEFLPERPPTPPARRRRSFLSQRRAA